MNRKLYCSALWLLISPLCPAQSGLADAATPGTTIHGDQDTAIGLFLTPWKEQAASTTDRPPRLFEVELAPLDASAFRHQVQLRQNIETQRMQRLHR